MVFSHLRLGVTQVGLESHAYCALVHHILYFIVILYMQVFSMYIGFVLCVFDPTVDPTGICFIYMLVGVVLLLSVCDLLFYSN